MKEEKSMSFRTIVISSKSKLTYKDGFLIIRGLDTNTVHLSEINTLVIETTAVSITGYLITELNKNKINVIFCDENRNPISEIIPYYGSHNTSKRIEFQINWNEEIKVLVWTEIIKEKIKNQYLVLKKQNSNNCKLLDDYLNNILLNDSTNREGVAAKVYFNSIFYKGFLRDEKNNINSALNYGYTILLSCFNREIVSRGYLTQLGINHKNQFNNFNFSCDLMEPFRYFVDLLVLENLDANFDDEYKMKLINLLNLEVRIKGRKHFMSNAIGLYVESVFKALNSENVNEIVFCEFYEE